MEDITYADYGRFLKSLKYGTYYWWRYYWRDYWCRYYWWHTKRVCKDFEIKNLGECHDFYFQSNKLFESFRNIYLEIYELVPAKFLSAPGLA